ncbi:hypothetical protein Tco_0036168, partial [Tanacetum coccineum]
ALSPGYVVDFDPEEDPADYPADEGDDDDDDEDESSEDDDEEEDSKEDEDEEEDHLASIDSAALPVVDLVPSAFAEAPFTTYAAAPTPSSPPPSLLSPLSSSLLEIPSPPLPLPSPPTHTRPTYTEAPLGYKAVGIRLRATSPLLLPAPSSPLLPLLLSIGRRFPRLIIRASERRTMASIAMVSLKDAQGDHAALRDEADTLRRHIMRIQPLEAGACVDTLEDTGCSA